MSELEKFVASELPAKSVLDLSTDGLALFNFIVLITDIKYRAKYGKPLERSEGRGYSVRMQHDNGQGDLSDGR